MKALKTIGKVDKQGNLVVPGTVDLPEGEVEVIILRPDPEQKRTARRPSPKALLKEPFVGMWADRTDISDSATYVDELRRRLEKRGDLG